MPFIATFHTDPAGSPLLATDNAGKVLWTENYAPFGDRYVKAKTGTNTQFFHGKEQDSTTGLQYFGARWYDPTIGRFMGVDPVTADPANKNGITHQFNRYAFANNNPYRFTDPDGRESNDPTEVLRGTIFDPSTWDMSKLTPSPPKFNAVIGVSGEITTGAGVGTSQQLYLSTGPFDVGLLSTASVTTGAAVGGSVQGGLIKGDRSALEGASFSGSGSVGPGAGTAIFDTKGNIIGFTGGVGIKGAWPAPASASVAANYSKITFSIKEAITKGSDLVKQGWDYVFEGKK